MNQGNVQSFTFKDKEGKQVSLTFTIDKNIVIDEKVERALKWFYDTVGKQQIKIKALEKENKFFQIALVKEYMKSIGFSQDVELRKAMEQLQSTEVSEVVQAWTWIQKEAKEEEKNELKKIQFKLDEGSILYKIILLNIFQAISFTPNLKQLTYLWELQQHEIYHLVSKLLLVYANKSDDNYNKICGFIVGKIEKIEKLEQLETNSEKDLIALELYNLIWLINELDTLPNSDRLIKQLKQKNIEKVIQQGYVLKIIELDDEELVKFPQLQQRKSAQVYKIEQVQFDEELKLFKIRLEKFKLDQQSLGLEIDKKITKIELIQKVKDQDATIQQQQDEIKLIREKLSNYVAGIEQVQQIFDKVLNNCKCQINQAYKTCAKPEEYGLLSFDNRKKVQQQGLMSFSRRAIEKPSVPFVITETLGTVVQIPQNIQKEQQQEQPQQPQQQIQQEQQQNQNNQSPTKSAPSVMSVSTPPTPGLPPPPSPGLFNSQPQYKNLLQSKFGVAIKQIAWNELHKDILSQSMWTQVKEDIDLIQSKISKELIIENFQKEEVKQQKQQIEQQQNIEQVQKQTKLDDKRSKEVHLSIKTLKIPIADLVQKIQNQEIDFFAPFVDDKRDTNKLSIAIKLCPKEEEIKIFKDITDQEILHDYDKAVVQVSKIPLYLEKLHLMLAYVESAQEEHKFIQQANILINLIRDQLLPDIKFFDTLKYMFAYGSFINQDNKRGLYKGTKLSDIIDVSIKTKSGKTFHYFVIKEMLNQNYEFDLKEDLKTLEQFSKQDQDFNLLKNVTLQQFQKYQQYCKSLLALEQKPDYVKLSDDVNFALEQFNQKLELIDQLSNKITLQVGEDPKKVQLWQLFDQILKFKQLVINLVQEIQQEEVNKEKRRLLQLSEQQRLRLGHAQGRH